MTYVEFLFALLMLGSLPALEDRAPMAQPEGAGLPTLLDAVDPVPQAMAQVRIEQRIVIRVPRQSLSRSSLLPMPAPRQDPPPEPPRFERRKIGKCLAMRDVTGVRVVNNDMLVLFMRDQRMIEARLERTCSARILSGFLYGAKRRWSAVCGPRFAAGAVRQQMRGRKAAPARPGGLSARLHVNAQWLTFDRCLPTAPA